MFNTGLVILLSLAVVCQGLQKSISPSFVDLLQSVYDSNFKQDVDHYKNPDNLTSINYNNLYDPYLSSASTLSTQSLDNLKYQFQKVARNGRLFTPNSGSAEFAGEWKINLVEVNFQSLLFGIGGEGGGHGRSFGSGDAENGETSEVVVFNQSALLVVGIIMVAAILIFPSLTQNLGLNKSDRHSDAENKVDGLDILDKIDEYLQSFGVDGHSCMNLMVCSAMEKVKTSALDKSGDPFEQVVQGLLEINQVKNFVKESKFGEAFETARNGEDCDAEFNRCPFSLGMLETMFNGWLKNVLGNS